MDVVRGERELQLTLFPNEIATKFDLSLDLEPQFESAKRYIRHHQKWLESIGAINRRSVNLHRQLWQHHLRLLDADLAGYGPKEIADVLSLEPDAPEKDLDEKKCWDRLKSARTMTEPVGYLGILVLKGRTR